MSEPPAPERIAVIWPPQAPAGLRAAGRETATQILCAINRHLASRNGGVKTLKPPLNAFRPRGGDYRAFRVPQDETTIEVIGVRTRREASR